MPDADREHLRGAYNAFRVGARLRTGDVRRLPAARGIEVSANRPRELGRDSGRGRPITARELAALIPAWADEERDTLR